MNSDRWRRVEEIFHQAAELAPPARPAFLDEACAGDESLRKEVESLLAHDSEDGATFAGPAGAPQAPGGLAAGQRVSHYQIQEKLAEGGMGAVYRAYDTQLHRPVALKVLPPEYASDPERRSRLLREARAASALHHPNIVGIHEVGSDSGVDFIAMELIEGKTLGDIIPARGLPLGKTLDYAVQIAGGLAKAHAAGVVHRDLKPGNIMLTRDGLVKLLDFGLAQRVELGERHDATLTVEGEIVGTPAYMSPEQAQGKPVDARSDVFSFGSVLCLMVTGQAAFEKGSLISTLAAVVEQEPRPLPSGVPRDLRKIIARCLRKDPARRFQHMDDVKVELEDLKAESDPRFQVSTPPARRRPRRKLWVAAGAVLLLSAAVLPWLAPKRHGFENYRFTPIEISRHVLDSLTWAPDGKAFSYPALVDGQPQVFVRYANSTAASQMTHEAGGASPIGWSADSKRIFFVGTNPQGDKPRYALFSVSVTGGEPEFLMPLAAAQGSVKGGISPDGRVLTIIQKEEDGAYSVATSSPAGSPLKRYSPAPFETKDISNYPCLGLSPDGLRILYFLNSNGQEQAWSLPFPAGSGTPKLVLKDLPHYGGTPEFSWFPDSRHIAISFQQRQGEAHRLWIVDTVTGSRAPLTTGLSNVGLPAVSPSGKQLLFVEVARDYRLFSASLADASVRTVISSQRPLGMPAWAPKSNQFVYQTDRTGDPEIWLHEADGSERPLVTPAMFPAGTTNWWMTPALSPAGGRLAYTRLATNDNEAIWISSLAGGPPVPLTNASEAVEEHMASWSPDGGRIAYIQDSKGGTSSLMICKTSGQATPMELRSEISVSFLPDWSPTGEWISFRDDSGWNLVSPDGKSSRALGKIATPHLTFSKDGQTLYGIRAEKEHQYLFSLSLAGNRMKTIGDVGTEFVPRSHLKPGVRFSLSPDGKSILYPSYSINTSLWMLEGFDAP
jgi:serine/threonine protein kinase/Tol biopolymer transport system component